MIILLTALLAGAKSPAPDRPDRAGSSGPRRSAAAARPDSGPDGAAAPADAGADSARPPAQCGRRNAFALEQGIDAARPRPDQGRRGAGPRPRPHQRPGPGPPDGRAPSLGRQPARSRPDHHHLPRRRQSGRPGRLPRPPEQRLFALGRRQRLAARKLRRLSCGPRRCAPTLIRAAWIEAFNAAVTDWERFRGFERL